MVKKEVTCDFPEGKWKSITYVPSNNQEGKRLLLLFKTAAASNPRTVDEFFERMYPDDKQINNKYDR